MVVEHRIQTPLVVANWKMHGLTEQTRNILTNIILTHDEDGNVAICPPYTALRPVANALESTKLRLGAQDVHTQDEGAFTGDISAPMLANIGCDYVIVGHSERRQYHHETDEQICKKADAARRHGIIPIICIGESEAEYESGDTIKSIEKQLLACLSSEKITRDNTIVAYEPLWAIGTGKTPTVEQITAVHRFIASYCAEHLPSVDGGLHTLYGGSVKAANARDILSIDAVDGVLVGSASVDTEEFRSIVDLACLIGERKK